MAFEPQNPDFEARIRESFERQTYMVSIGAVLGAVNPGSVEIRLPKREDLLQQHGFFHGAVVGAIADNAGGYSSFTLMRAADSVLTVEYKVNIMSPAVGDDLIAVGNVVKAGRTLTVCGSDVFAVTNGKRKLCATMLGTFMTLADTPDYPHSADDRHKPSNKTNT